LLVIENIKGDPHAYLLAVIISPTHIAHLWHLEGSSLSIKLLHLLSYALALRSNGVHEPPLYIDEDEFISPP